MNAYEESITDEVSPRIKARYYPRTGRLMLILDDHEFWELGQKTTHALHNFLHRVVPQEPRGIDPYEQPEK